MPKLLFLSIYNEDQYYDQMLNQMNRYVKSLIRYDIKYIFITLKPIDSPYSFDSENNILTINGEDSLRPGILNKTIKAIDIVTNDLKWDYDFIIRTTVATCINVPKLINMLDSLEDNRSYYIGNLQQLHWIDKYHNIVDETYWGTWYTGGGFSIFSKEIAHTMLDNRDKFLYDIVDDLAIGEFIGHLQNVEYLNWTEFAEFWGKWNPNKVFFFNNTNKEQREIDVNNQENILTNLLELNNVSSYN